MQKVSLLATPSYDCLRIEYKCLVITLFVNVAIKIFFPRTLLAHKPDSGSSEPPLVSISGTILWNISSETFGCPGY